MQYADVDGEKVQAFRGGRGSCPMCGSVVVAKCGVRLMHHWAHFGRRDCDPWWENETAWHRSWKALFPEAWLEVSHVAPDGEIHRADIKTPKGMIVEVQHSAMSDSERVSREEFYKNLVWVVDGRAFEQNFDLYHLLPDPSSELAADLVWVKATRVAQGAAMGLFFRLSECQQEDANVTKATVNGGWYHGIAEIRDRVHAAYRGHHQYDWVRPRRTWLDATCPVYIDFGKEHLVKLDVYDESGLRCVRLVSKKKFVHDVMTEDRAVDIATRFYAMSACT